MVRGGVRKGNKSKMRAWSCVVAVVVVVVSEAQADDDSHDTKIFHQNPTFAHDGEVVGVSSASGALFQ
ncbi:hypothetical protein Hamer_G013523 [Homarus americanus]|uniref:Uncharacterized protein n=1 Tax=Homarus americanus TaxID=6706 RepID=A0A8J5KGE5_HOMAM|nr:hypothetical protein Hamer_G013523 [Homarus americanus]